MPILTDIDELRRVLEGAKHVAVLGAHADTAKPAYYVPDYLAANGYEIYPVNPVYEGKILHGRETVANVSDLMQPADVLDIFRRAEHLPNHLDDILKMDPRPKVVWFQLGIRHDEVAEALSDAGIDVVQSRCMLADHKRLL